jgi:hypothetical protein
MIESLQAVDCTDNLVLKWEKADYLAGLSHIHVSLYQADDQRHIGDRQKSWLCAAPTRVDEASRI